MQNPSIKILTEEIKSIYVKATDVDYVESDVETRNLNCTFRLLLS